MQQISLLIVDDHPIVLEGMKALLVDHASVLVKACCIDGQSTLAFLKQDAVDVILLDINLPDISGIDLCKEIRSSYPDTHVIAISNYNERSMITKMLQNGASGYILKNAGADEIIEAITTVVYNGNTFFSPEVQKALVEAALEDPLHLPKLTRREQEVLRCIAAGKTTAEIGDSLFISPHTVETHRRNLMQKFDVSNAAALIRIATQYELI
ncbi:response regulator transcription factor [Olivibacter ginsenosidimutans]|uniref:Response regulator transcription factor n=1 Tax=Olivibacter ginsenosidimutans TaxID=1176537 RepID=A0ABP9C8Q0_9SPHI